MTPCRQLRDCGSQRLPPTAPHHGRFSSEPAFDQIGGLTRIGWGFAEITRHDNGIDVVEVAKTNSLSTHFNLYGSHSRRELNDKIVT